MTGGEDRVFIGRSEQVDLAKGISSNYACVNCCGNSFYDGWLTPGQGDVFEGDVIQFTAMQQDANCYGSTFSAYEIWANFSGNPSICNPDSNGLATGIAPGQTGIFGQWSADNATGLQVEQLALLSCNIDDMNPQWYEPLMKHLYDAGALDVWLTPVQMKKNRPAVVVEVLCPPENAASVRDLLLRHTTTLGVRETAVARHSLPRHVETVQTVYGAIRMKVATLPDGSVKASPEHDDCAAQANLHGVGVSDVWLAAIQAGKAANRHDEASI